MKEIKYYDNQGICPYCGKRMLLQGCINFKCKENKRLRSEDEEFDAMMKHFILYNDKLKVKNKFYMIGNRSFVKMWVECNGGKVWGKNLDNTQKKTYNNGI